ncbi:hypothetical protein Ddc_10115 [Ditylenchus destructor]|nr:hypothetical protein Ddc_10115 [Ditylenchus destructor]
MQKSTLILCLCIFCEANLIQNKEFVINQTGMKKEPDTDDEHNNCFPICEFLNLEDLQRKYGIGFGIGWSKYGNTSRSFGICICDGEVDQSATGNRRKCLEALRCNE